VYQLSSQDLSNIIWALATLRVRPNGDWMALFMSASAASLAMASSPQELVNSMWGLQVRAVPLYHTCPVSHAACVFLQFACPPYCFCLLVSVCLLVCLHAFVLSYSTTPAHLHAHTWRHTSFGPT